MPTVLHTVLMTWKNPSLTYNVVQDLSVCQASLIQFGTPRCLRVHTVLSKLQFLNHCNGLPAVQWDNCEYLPPLTLPSRYIDENAANLHQCLMSLFWLAPHFDVMKL